jgi:MFS family permease
MIPLFAATISVFFSITILIPVIPQYVHSVLLANDVAVGIVMSMQAVGAISARMIVGKIIAQYGTRKAMILGGVIVIVGALAYFLPSSILTLCLGRLLQGVGEGFAFTSGTTWVLNAAPANSRGRYVALFGLALWLGGSFAPPLGSFLMTHFGFKSDWGFAAFIACVGTTILLAASKQQHKASLEKTRFEWIAKESLRPGIILCLASSGYVAIATFGTLFFTSQRWVGGSLPVAAFGMGFVVMRFFGGKILDYMDLKKVTGYCVLLEAAGLLGMSISPSPVLAIMSSFITGLGLALIYPALAISAVHGVTHHRQGTVIGWYTAFWDISLFTSNILFGWIACLSGGYRMVFLGGCAITSLSLIGISNWKNPIKHLSKEDQVFESM